MTINTSEMLRGFTETLTLGLIGPEGDYIYNLVKKIKERSHGFFNISNPSLLLVMKKMLSLKLVSCKNELNERGVNRKRYFLTEEGKRYRDETKSVCIQGAETILSLLKEE